MHLGRGRRIDLKFGLAARGRKDIRPVDHQGLCAGQGDPLDILDPPGRQGRRQAQDQGARRKDQGVKPGAAIDQPEGQVAGNDPVIAPAAIGDIPRIGLDPVGPDLAIEAVIAELAQQGVIAIAADQQVIARPTIQQIIVPAADHPVAAGGSDIAVCPAAHIDIAAEVAAGEVAAVSALAHQDDAIDGPPVDQAVIAQIQIDQAVDDPCRLVDDGFTAGLGR